MDLERQMIFAHLAKILRTNHSLLYGAGVLHASFFFFLVKTMEFLSVRQKQGTQSGSHMVNTKENHTGCSLENWWPHHTRAVPFTPLASC